MVIYSSLRRDWSTLRSLLLTILAVLVAGCGEIERLEPGPAGEAPGQAGSPPRVVATTGMIHDLLQNILPPGFEVTGLIPSGVDPHLFRPTRQHVILLRSADVLVYNGLHLEGRMGDTFRRLPPETRTLPLAERVALGAYLLTGEDSDEADPHVWMDVAGWSKAAAAALEFFADLYPDEAALLRGNAARYLGELQLLHDYVTRITATIPENQRVLVTAHDAFGYFGRAYGLEVMAVQGISTESEAGLHDVEDLVATIVKRAVPAVFFETSVSDRNVRAIIEGAAARGHRVEIGGELYSDSMGTEGTYTGTYIGMMDHNATTITRALGGNAPAGGFREFLSSL